MGKDKAIVQDIAILMATFNGETYLESQLNSIESQSLDNWNLYVLDSGSTDRTLELLQKYEKKGVVSKVFLRSNYGATQAFFELIRIAPKHKYYFFSDQDDIWDVDKLKIMSSHFHDKSPQLVVSRRNYIDDDSHKFGMSRNLKKPLNLSNALIENSAPGNSIAMNYLAMEQVKKSISIKVEYWDAWIYLLVAIVGEISFINTPLTNYRIHKNNTIGLRKIRNLHLLGSNLDYYLANARYAYDFCGIYSPNPKKIEIISDFIKALSSKNPLRRLLRIMLLPISRQRYGESFILKVLLYFFSS